MAAATLIRQALPQLDDPVVDYLDGYIDDAADDPTEDLFESVVRPMLESACISDPSSSKQVHALLPKLLELIQSKLPDDADAANANGLTRLDKVVDMRNTEMSRTSGFDSAGGVDIALGTTKQNRSTVDVKKLEKQEAKTRAKLAKRAQRDLYESSKLVQQSKQQASYEELFLKVNPIESIGNKGKNKDIHLPNIDVNFGSNRILSNATLTIKAGRRAGVIGRNGVGKSTLLRNMALREVPIPTSISILYVEQEITGDDTPAIESVLKADVWRAKLMQEEAEINAELQKLEDSAAAAVAAANAAAAAQADGTEGDDDATAGLSRGSAVDMPTRQREIKREELSARLGEVQAKLVDMEAETGPARAASLLNGLGFKAEDQLRATKTFSGGWRMRLALARALFCKPDLLMLDEPSNHLDLNALAWLEDYFVNDYQGTLLVVSHDRAFLNRVATDIIHMHSERLDYYKGNFDQFYQTREERRRNQQREYEAVELQRAQLQAFIDRWRVNANRAAQAQSKIKQLEKLPHIEPPEDDDVVHFRLPETEKLPLPLLQISNVTFGYRPDRLLLKSVDFDITQQSRVAVVGPNGAGKSTLMKLLMGEITPLQGDQKRNSRLRVGFFSQHHIDQLDLNANPVSFLASKYPGKTEQEYRSHLGAFGIKGMTGLQKIATLSGGQKSRVAFAHISMMRPHVLLLDEPTNHLDTEGLDALCEAIKKFNGGVICISHDETFIHNCLEELWVVDDGRVEKFAGDVAEYKKIILSKNKDRAARP
ncbi:ATPase components of ABC transporters with duplicated ATPase domains [Pseudozyma hubeiensis SY62]|uniref:ATPase components of ABC transporters with duplicated ATPase domains n=1 Tax=Pseudozyma hubeiensis (strain SY62) TaxID=1305764 RepID=R9P317_PSEHS|nr:ATPase components of ABC transporters with duplicated ATPase domains [Pseudozyma hubeiensis SY62]GAC92495.1 ATPase components of ABC transporters with duplicated ATPase domains [Pseudozyma hubeiensis SY62]